jgi:hypothetical protein
MVRVGQGSAQAISQDQQSAAAKGCRYALQLLRQSRCQKCQISQRDSRDQVIVCRLPLRFESDSLAVQVNAYSAMVEVDSRDARNQAVNYRNLYN